MTTNKWHELTINDLGSVITGKTPPTKKAEFWNGSFPFITPKDIKEDSYHIETERFLSDKWLEKSSKYLLPPGTTCVVCIGATIGKTCHVEKNSFCNQQINAVVPNRKKFDDKFIFYLLGTLKNEIKSIAGGAATPIVNKSAFSNINIKVPSLSIQQKIASILSAYDDLIENNNRRIAILEEMARRLYDEWFVKFRFPGHEKVKIVDSELGLIPEGWEVKRFGELVYYRRDSVPKGVLPEPTPYIGLEHMPRRSIALSNWDTVTEIGSTKLKFKAGDILFGKIRPYFHKVGVAQIDGVCSSDAFVLRPKEGFDALVVCIASSDDFVAHSVKTSQGTKMPRANWDVLQDYKVPLATSALLAKFESVVDSMIDMIGNLSAKNRNLRQHRDMLLPKLISGKIDLSSQ